MSRLSIQVFLPVSSCIVESAAIYIMVVKFRNTVLIAPLHLSSPFIGGLRCQAIQTEHGPYITVRTQKAVYIVRCLWYNTVNHECAIAHSVYNSYLLVNELANLKWQCTFNQLLRKCAILLLRTLVFLFFFCCTGNREFDHLFFILEICF
jgi:hypothetical protein